jgi:hypothetical protein
VTENNKPEWFQIAESDGPSAPAKVRRTLPLAAVLTAALIIGIGAVVAQTQDESPANATESTSVAKDQTPSPLSSASQSPTSSAEKTPSPIASSTDSGIANPNIAHLPNGEEGREHDGREHHGERPHFEGDHPHPEGDDD